MKLPRRQFLQLSAATAAVPILPRRTWALDYPARTVRIIVGFPAGGTTDIGARLIAQSLSEGLGLGFRVDGFWAAFWGALVVSIVSTILSMLVSESSRQEK